MIPENTIEEDFFLTHGCDDEVGREDHLEHAYDPIKAREYYLRTRELKGRKKGTEKESFGNRSSGSGVKTKVVKPKANEQARIRREALAKKLEQTEAKLKQLREVLAKLVEQAKARSIEGYESKEEKSSDDSSKKTPEKKLTAQEKRDAAKDAKERREKEKKTPVDEKLEKAREQISEIQDKIKDLRAKLAAENQKSRR